MWNSLVMFFFFFGWPRFYSKYSADKRGIIQLAFRNKIKSSQPSTMALFGDRDPRVNSTDWFSKVCAETAESQYSGSVNTRLMTRLNVQKNTPRDCGLLDPVAATQNSDWKPLILAGTLSWCSFFFTCFKINEVVVGSTLGTLSKTRRQRQREHHQKRFNDQNNGCTRSL